MDKIYMMVSILPTAECVKALLAFFKENDRTRDTDRPGSREPRAAKSWTYLWAWKPLKPALYFAFITGSTWKSLKKALYNKMQIDIPGRGIAFLIPFSSIGGRKVLQYLTVGQGSRDRGGEHVEEH